MILIAYFLQNGLFPSVFYFQSIPNILLMLTVIHGFLRGSLTGVLTGLVCGFLCDMHSGTLIGYYTFFYIYAGWFGGLFQRFFYQDELVLPGVLTGVCDFLYGCYMFVFECVLHNNTNFKPYLMQIILPEMIYTIIVTILFFRIILFVHDKLDDAEKRSARKFV